MLGGATCATFTPPLRGLRLLPSLPVDCPLGSCGPSSQPNRIILQAHPGVVRPTPPSHFPSLSPGRHLFWRLVRNQHLWTSLSSASYSLASSFFPSCLGRVQPQHSIFFSQRPGLSSELPSRAVCYSSDLAGIRDSGAVVQAWARHTPEHLSGHPEALVQSVGR